MPHPLAIVEVLAGVGRHGLDRYVTADGAGDRGLCLQIRNGAVASAVPSAALYASRPARFDWRVALRAGKPARDPNSKKEYAISGDHH